MKREALFAASIIAASIASGGAAFFKYAVARDYLVYANVPCNPLHESCFIGDGEGTPEFYKSIEMAASALPRCDAWAGACPVLSCEVNSADCNESFCEPGGESGCYGPLLPRT